MRLPSQSRAAVATPPLAKLTSLAFPCGAAAPHLAAPLLLNLQRRHQEASLTQLPPAFLPTKTQVDALSRSSKHSGLLFASAFRVYLTILHLSVLVDQLLAKGVNVTVYSGQLDVIFSTKGTEAWVEKLKWDGLKTFLSMDRTPLFCGKEKITKGFIKSYRNLHFYWILGAGHFVPVDQPCIALNMISSITQSSPIASK